MDTEKRKNQKVQSGCMKIILAFVIGAVLITIIMANPLVGLLISIAYFVDKWFLKNKIVPKQFYKKYNTINDLDKKETDLQDRLKAINIRTVQNQVKAVADAKEFQEDFDAHKVSLENEIEKYSSILKDAKESLRTIDEEAVISETSIDIFNDKTSAELKNELELLKMEERDLIKKTGVKFYIEPSTKKEKTEKQNKLLEVLILKQMPIFPI